MTLNQSINFILKQTDKPLLCITYRASMYVMQSVMIDKKIIWITTTTSPRDHNYSPVVKVNWHTIVTLGRPKQKRIMSTFYSFRDENWLSLYKVRYILCIIQFYHILPIKGCFRVAKRIMSLMSGGFTKLERIMSITNDTTHYEGGWCILSLWNFKKYPP